MHGGPIRYQSTTGLTRDDILEITARIWEVLQPRGIDFSEHKLGLYQQVHLTLSLLRNNVSQMFIADLRGISQSTASRRIYRRMCPLIQRVLAFTGISLEQAVEDGHLLLVDGTFVPTGNRPASDQERANFSGKHRAQCLSLQIAATSDGQLLAVSDPAPGSRHDAKALELCGWKTTLDQVDVDWIADTAYIATTARTPIKKSPGRERIDWEREYNRTVASLRAPVEHAIAHLKDWKILATGYRGRLAELPRLISLVTRLKLFQLGW